MKNNLIYRVSGKIKRGMYKMKFELTTDVRKHISCKTLPNFEDSISLLNKGFFNSRFQENFNFQLDSTFNINKTETDRNISVTINKLVPSENAVLLVLSVAINGNQSYGNFETFRILDDTGGSYRSIFNFFSSNGNINLILNPPIKENTKYITIELQDFKCFKDNDLWDPVSFDSLKYRECNFSLKIDLHNLGVVGCKAINLNETRTITFIDIPVTFRNIIIYPESFSFELQGYEEMEDLLANHRLHTRPIYQGDSGIVWPELTGRTRSGASQKKVKAIIDMRKSMVNPEVFKNDRIAEKFWHAESLRLDRKGMFNIYYVRHRVTNRDFSDIINNIALLILNYNKDNTPPFISLQGNVDYKDIERFL